MNKLLTLTLFIICAISLQAQSDKQQLRKGNRAYNKDDFEQAANSYRNALDKNPLNDKASFNLGNALFRQNNFDEALERFKSTADMTRDRNREARALYNAGNSLLEAGKYGESIPFYQGALRIDPNDDDARYNLAYAMRMMQQQQQQQNNQNQDNKRDNQQQQSDNQQNNNNDQQQSQNNQQQNQDNNQQQPQNRQPQLSKEEAERLIQALTSEEKRTMDKVNQQRFKTGPRVTREKDW